jgi:large subunit ribosomal protein L22
MQAQAHVKHVRISPRKVHIVAELIRGKDVKRAEAILKHTPKAACEPLLKLLGSATANAENNFNLDVDDLYVSEVLVGAGATLKRIMPRAKGRAYRILKRTSHISLTVRERDGDQ